MNAYCTMTDTNYLIKVLAMYYSLVETGDEFKLYVLTYDRYADSLLKRQGYENIITIFIGEVETERLLRIKAVCNKSQYCWAGVPAEMDYIFEKYNEQEITYLDGDLFFFDKPSILIDEFHQYQKDVMLTLHNYPEGEVNSNSGDFCVQFLPIRNNEGGRKFLSWWREKCEESYLNPDKGQFEDQRCLTEAVKKYNNIYVMKNIQGGVAPWNVKKYIVTDGPCVDNKRIVFYHFHDLKWLGDSRYGMPMFFYTISDDARTYVYKPYIEMLKMVKMKLEHMTKCTFEHGIFMLPNVGDVVFFGTGNYGQKAAECIRNYQSECKVIAYCDNDPKKQGGMIDGIPILSVEKAVLRYGSLYFWVQGKYEEEMKRQLVSLGIKKIINDDLINIYSI